MKLPWSKPTTHELPLEYRWLAANGFDGFVPWYLIDEPGAEELRKEYKKETGQDFYPFARRQDCDDVAGFCINGGKLESKVVTVHLTWSGGSKSSGYPRMTVHDDIFEWLRNDVIPATKEWMSEDDLKDITDSAS
jgi:hypothetical protein